MEVRVDHVIQVYVDKIISIALGYITYITPPYAYLLTAAQRKYSQNICVIGTPEEQLNGFWDSVEIKIARSQTYERLVEDSRIIVDITSKEHCNTGTEDDVLEVETAQEELKNKRKVLYLVFWKRVLMGIWCQCKHWCFLF